MPRCHPQAVTQLVVVAQPWLCYLPGCLGSASCASPCIVHAGHFGHRPDPVSPELCPRQLAQSTCCLNLAIVPSACQHTAVLPQAKMHAVADTVCQPNNGFDDHYLFSTTREAWNPERPHAIVSKIQLARASTHVAPIHGQKKGCDALYAVQRRPQTRETGNAPWRWRVTAGPPAARQLQGPRRIRAAAADRWMPACMTPTHQHSGFSMEQTVRLYKLGCLERTQGVERRCT